MSDSPACRGLWCAIRVVACEEVGRSPLTSGRLRWNCNRNCNCHETVASSSISSYTFEEGEKDHPKDEVVIHVVLEHECKPKAKV